MKTLFLILLALASVAASAAQSTPGPLQACYQRILDPTWGFPFDVPKFHAMLEDKAWNGEKLIDFLSESADLRELFEGDAWTLQGYTVRSHTMRVHRRLADQFRFFPTHLPPIEGMSWRAFFKLLVCLHDIAKSVARELGDKRLHHVYSANILEQVMVRLGCTPKQRHLARSLIDHDLIADAIRKVGTIQASVLGIQARAMANGMSPADYFRAQAFFFTIDASSYTNVRRMHFHRVGGQLHPTRHLIYPQLEAHFLQP